MQRSRFLELRAVEKKKAALARRLLIAPLKELLT
jgi:hypothetical protein